MDIIKLTNPHDTTRMEGGVFVHGIKTKMWVEKYRDASEFTFTAPIDSGVREQLPIDTFITHMNTSEIMIVENHEINESNQAVPEIKITGRSMETFLEDWIVGCNRTFPQSGIVDYILAAANTWVQAQTLIIEQCIWTPSVPTNQFPYLRAVTSVSGITGEIIERNVPFSSTYPELLKLLALDDLGIKVVRPGPSSPLVGDESICTALVIHSGTDRSKEVVFSYNIGEVVSADYLWSNKTLKNAAFVSGRWVQIPYYGPEAGYNRKTMFVDGSSIDKDYPSAPTGDDLTNVMNAMQVLAREALSTQNRLVMSKAEVRKDATKAVYRKDFDLGDLVMVMGDYDQAQIMRVSEYVEIEDSSGESGYPTLTVTKG